MALKLSVSTQFGVPAPEAYAKITNFYGTKDQLVILAYASGAGTPKAYAKITNFYGTKDQLQVQVAIYFNADAREQNLSTVKENAHYIAVEDINGKGDLIPAIYAVLKTFADYEGAEDC